MGAPAACPVRTVRTGGEGSRPRGVDYCQRPRAYTSVADTTAHRGRAHRVGSSCPQRWKVAMPTEVQAPFELDMSAFDRWLLEREWRQKNLTEPPPGLKPVTGDSGLPLVGHALEILRLGMNFPMVRYRTHGPVSWASAFGVKLVTGSGPEATQEVLANRDKAYSQAGW